MFIVFEGIDGSGKTTISNRVAKALRGRGMSVEHLREEGAFASQVTQGIRDFCRDARNLALTPRAELMLYLAREVQLADEVLRPALQRAEVVIADRYFYTAEVLAQGRDLPPEETGPIVAAAAHGLWPDLAFLIDVDPSVARGRRKVAKTLASDRRPVSRKGLTGSGLQLRLRAGYVALAAREPERWIVVENSDADLDQVVELVVQAILRARTGGSRTAMTEVRARLKVLAPPYVPPVIDGVRAAFEAFLAWVDRRAVHEPALAAYVLGGTAGEGIDTRRFALAPIAPRIVARGLKGLADAASWQLRRQLLASAPAEVAASLSDAAAEAPEAWTLRERLADEAPAEVAASLEGLDDETAWALREALFSRAPEAVLGSLALLDGPRAWGLRHRWVEARTDLERAAGNYARARALARSVTGLEGPEAWQMRKAARAHAPVAALASLKGLTSEKAWRWREREIGRASKAVLSTIAGMDDARAWALRVATVLRCREAFDSMIGLDHETAWELRESCLDVWPPNVIKSLGVLVSGARGNELLVRALARFSDQISLLKQAAQIATGANLTRAVLAA